MLDEKSLESESEQKSIDIPADQIVLNEITCFALIQEFLVHKGLNKTSDQLYNECQENKLDCPTSDSIETSISQEDAHNILSAFDSEDIDAFVKLWDEKVPTMAQSTDHEAWRLLFLAHVSYATKHHEAGMEMLKQFIANKPISANQKEMLQYYALPYIANPQKHQSFAHLYKESWVSELRTSLMSFLRRYTKPHNRPRLMQLLSSNSEQTLANHRQLRKKHRQLQTDYQRLLAVAGELTTALENAVRGETLDLASTLHNCTSIFPELFPSTRDGSRRASPESVLRRSLNQGGGRRNSVPDFELDMRKVKAHFASSENNKTRLLLMQALRWRITKSNAEDREHTVAAIVRHDLLGLRGGFCLLSLLDPPQGDTPHPLQQGVARLGNALASLRSGRDYLSTQVEQVVGVTSSCLTGMARPGLKVDDVTGDMLLALLQKLSLRRAQREAMITAGMVEWLIPKLEACLDEIVARPDTPTYSLEYATALLMNLCLHSRAKQRCVPLSGRALKLLSDMLGVAPPQVLPYVNGALYSLLSEPLINQQARHMGLEKLLQFYLKQSDGELSRQLEHILRLHRGDCGPEPPEAHSEDEGEADIATSIEILEEELDANDPVRASDHELAGEELLREHYRQLFPAHGVVTPQTAPPGSSQSSFAAVGAASRFKNRRTMENTPDLNKEAIETIHEAESESGTSFKAITAASKFLKNRSPSQAKEDEVEEEEGGEGEEGDEGEEVDETGTQESKGTSFGALRASTKFLKNRPRGASTDVEPEQQDEAPRGTSFGAVRASTKFLKNRPRGVSVEVEEEPATGGTSFGALKASTKFLKNKPKATTEATEIEPEESKGTSFGALRASTKFLKNRSKGSTEPEEVEIATEESSGGTSFGAIKASTKFLKNKPKGTVEPEIEIETQESSGGSTSFGALRASTKFLKNRSKGESIEPEIPLPEVTARLLNRGTTDEESAVDPATLPSLSSVTATVRFLNNRRGGDGATDGEPEGEGPQLQPTLSAVSATVRFLNKRANTAASSRLNTPGNTSDVGDEASGAEEGAPDIAASDAQAAEIQDEVTGPDAAKDQTSEVTKNTEETAEQTADDDKTPTNTEDTTNANKPDPSSVAIFFSTPKLARTPPVSRRLQSLSTDQAGKIASLVCGISHVHVAKEEPPKSDP